MYDDPVEIVSKRPVTGNPNSRVKSTLMGTSARQKFLQYKLA